MALTEPTGTVAVVLWRGDAFRRPATLRWWRGDPYRLVLDDRWRGDGPDLFAALAALRRCVEAEGWRVGVRGARLDAYPSGMARDMGGGERVYLTTMGRPASSADLVDTLEPEPDSSLLATVDEQERRHRAWIRS